MFVFHSCLLFRGPGELHGSPTTDSYAHILDWIELTKTLSIADEQMWAAPCDSFELQHFLPVSEEVCGGQYTTCALFRDLHYLNEEFL